MITIDLTRIRFRNWREKVLMAFVWKLPRSIVGWCVVRATAHATSGKWSKDSPHDLDPLDILNRWNDDNPEGLGADVLKADKARSRQHLIQNIEIMVIILSGWILLGLLLYVAGILK